jgi:hypothetical protein
MHHKYHHHYHHYHHNTMITITLLTPLFHHTIIYKISTSHSSHHQYHHHHLLLLQPPPSTIISTSDLNNHPVININTIKITHYHYCHHNEHIIPTIIITMITIITRLPATLPLSLLWPSCQLILYIYHCRLSCHHRIHYYHRIVIILTYWVAAISP